MSSLQTSWERTTCLLKTAKALLPPEVVSFRKSDLQQFDEFLDVNELGLAFEWLSSIAYEHQPTCLPLLRLLKAAASEMGCSEDVAELGNRIQALEQPLAE